MHKGTLLRRRLLQPNPVVIIAAHNPLGARLAERAGFDGVWASGFELSASYGVPDASLLSMTQHLDMLRAIADAVDLPVVADIDTGYGNAVNVVHAVRQYDRAGAAAVVIEDKKFPKTTSLLESGRQTLVPIEEFEGKVAAAVDARRDSPLMVIARTEALIAGLGLDEALQRAHHYAEAGADAILIHSKSRTPDEVLGFVEAWERETPLVLVPTNYPSLTEAKIAELGKVKLVVYGNHTVRAIVTALEQVYAQIRKDGGVLGVEDRIATVAEVFELQGYEDLERLESRFLR